MKATLDEGHQMMADLHYDYGEIPRPVPVSAEIGIMANNLLVITFDLDLDPASTPDATDFSTTGVYLNAQPAGIAIVGNEVRLTLANNARCDDTITVSYSVPMINGLKSLTGGYVESFTNFSVTTNIFAGTDNEPIISPNGTAYLLCQNQLALSLKESVEVEFIFYFYDKYDSPINEPQNICDITNNQYNYLKIGISDNSNELRIIARVQGFVATAIYKVNFFNNYPDWYKVKVNWSGTSLKIYKNDILISNETVQNLNSILQFPTCSLSLLYGNPPDTGIAIRPNNKLCSFKYKTNGSLISHYPICEESGNIAYNIISNAYHLTGQAGYNALTWSRDNNFDKYLRDYGYRLTGGVYIPGLLSGASAADGNPLTEWSPCTEFN